MCMYHGSLSSHNSAVLYWWHTSKRIPTGLLEQSWKVVVNKDIKRTQTSGLSESSNYFETLLHTYTHTQPTQSHYQAFYLCFITHIQCDTISHTQLSRATLPHSKIYWSFHTGFDCKGERVRGWTKGCSYFFLMITEIRKVGIEKGLLMDSGQHWMSMKRFSSLPSRPGGEFIITIPATTTTTNPSPSSQL